MDDLMIDNGVVIPPKSRIEGVWMTAEKYGEIISELTTLSADLAEAQAENERLKTRT